MTCTDLTVVLRTRGLSPLLPVPRQVMILMSGMVFLSKGFSPGSAEATALTAFVSSIVVVSTASFVAFVAFEVFRSIKYAKLHEHTRRAEADRIEKSMLQATRRNRLLRAAATARAADGDGAAPSHRDKLASSDSARHLVEVWVL